jgi:hypothetical protein
MEVFSADTLEVRFIEAACIAAVGRRSPADWKAAEVLRMRGPVMVETRSGMSVFQMSALRGRQDVIECFWLLVFTACPHPG